MSWCAESSCRAGAISASIVDDFPSSQIFPTCRLVYIALQGQLMEEEDLAGVPVLVFANKQDLLGAMTGAEIMEALELTSFKDRWVHVEVSRCTPHIVAGIITRARRACDEPRVLERNFAVCPHVRSSLVEAQ